MANKLGQGSEVIVPSGQNYLGELSQRGSSPAVGQKEVCWRAANWNTGKTEQSDLGGVNAPRGMAVTYQGGVDVNNNSSLADRLQDFSGFHIPHYTPIPDEILDKLLDVLTGGQLKVLLYIARHTLGYKKSTDQLSAQQIAEGVVRRDGTRVDYGTGLKVRQVRNIVAQLEAFKLIEVTRNQGKDGWERNTYSLRMADLVEFCTPKAKSPASKPATTGRPKPATTAPLGPEPVVAAASEPEPVTAAIPEPELATAAPPEPVTAVAPKLEPATAAPSELVSPAAPEVVQQAAGGVVHSIALGVVQPSAPGVVQSAAPPKKGWQGQQEVYKKQQQQSPSAEIDSSATQSPQTDVVVTCCELPTANDLPQHLGSLGVIKPVANKLLKEHDPDFIHCWVRYIENKLRNGWIPRESAAALLVSAIRNHWLVPMWFEVFEEQAAAEARRQYLIDETLRQEKEAIERERQTREAERQALEEALGIDNHIRMIWDRTRELLKERKQMTAALFWTYLLPLHDGIATLITPVQLTLEHIKQRAEAIRAALEEVTQQNIKCVKVKLLTEEEKCKLNLCPA